MKQTQPNDAPLIQEVESSNNEPYTMPEDDELEEIQCDEQPVLPQKHSVAFAKVTHAMSAIYHEKQQAAMCGMHALNNAIGFPYNSASDMEHALRTYLADAKFEGLPEEAHDHAAPGGWFSSEVLAFAMRSTPLRRGAPIEYVLTLEALKRKPHIIHHCVGAVVNQANTHWLALRSIEGSVWLIDSNAPAPRPLSPDEYVAFINRYVDAYPIYRV